jgi:uncharacterized membrane protein YfcA
VELLLIAATAMFASFLTFFSGFGLGTLLMPVAALFFPVDVAIGVTALVHLANNVFKLGIVGLRAKRAVVLRFGIPAMVAAFAGALVLDSLSHMGPLMQYELGSRQFQLMPVKMVVGALIILFVLLELIPAFKNLAFPEKLLPAGGLLSGFFGGLSGNQGALRSMFLLKAGLDSSQYIATGVVIAVLVDLSRLSVYGWSIMQPGVFDDWMLLVVASLSAFAGALVGRTLLDKVTILHIRILVSGLLGLVGCGLLMGVL